MPARNCERRCRKKNRVVSFREGTAFDHDFRCVRLKLCKQLSLSKNIGDDLFIMKIRIVHIPQSIFIGEFFGEMHATIIPIG